MCFSETRISGGKAPLPLYTSLALANNNTAFLTDTISCLGLNQCVDVKLDEQSVPL